MTQKGVRAAWALAFFVVPFWAFAADFFSQGSLAPDALSSWNSMADGSGAAPANFTSGDVFRIQNGHSMTTSAAWTISGSGSKIWIESGGSLTAGHVVTVAAASVFQIDGGGSYVQNVAMTMATSIFAGTESFAAASNFEFKLYPTAAAAPTAPGYGNLTINSSTAGNFTFGSALGSVQNDLIILKTSSSGGVCYLNNAAGVTVGGNLTMSGGSFVFAQSGSPTLAVAGNFVMTGGSFSISGGSTNSDRPIMAVQGDFNLSAGQFYITDCCGGTVGDLRLWGNFTVSGSGNVTRNNGTPRILLYGSGKTMNLRNGQPSSGGSFIVMPGATYAMAANSFFSGSSIASTICGELDFGSNSPVFANLQVRGGTLKGLGGTLNGSSSLAHLVCDAEFLGGNLTYTCATGGPFSGLIDLSGSVNYASDATVTLQNGGELRLNGSAQMTGSGAFSIATTGGILEIGPLAKIAGSRTFVVNAPTTPGATVLKIGSTAGITSSGATGNIQNTGARTFAAADYWFNGTAAQATGSGLPATINGLAIDNSSGVTLTNDATVSSSLVLTNGILSATLKRLTLAAAATVSGGSSASFVNVMTTLSTAGLKRLTGGFFPVGEGANGWFMPITLTNSGAADNFSVRLETLTAGLDNPAKAVQRQWNITEDAAGGSSATVVFGYPSAAVGSSYDLAAASGQCLHFVSAAWTVGPAAISVGEPFSATCSGIASFSPFSVGTAGALPLEWLDIRAQALPFSNKISWKTARETALLAFFVEKSDDGATDWQPIFEPPATNRDEPTTYFFEEKSPSRATFYRIRSVGTDGQNEFSKLLFLERKSDADDRPTVWPNPVGAGGEAIFSFFSKGTSESVLQIFGADGRLVFDQKMSFEKGQNQKRLALEGLPSGLFVAVFEGRAVHFLKN